MYKVIECRLRAMQSTLIDTKDIVDSLTISDSFKETEELLLVHFAKRAYSLQMPTRN